MCLLAFAWRAAPGLRLAFVGNRDEFHARPTAALHRWSDAPQVLAGRDLEAGGTWCGVGANGRVAALTNFRSTEPSPPSAPSRGELVAGFLSGNADAAVHAARLQATAHRYAGFSMLLADAGELWLVSNRERAARRLEAGIHGLSNATLDAPWPKLLRARTALQDAVDRGAMQPAALAELLLDRTPATLDHDPLAPWFRERYGEPFVRAMSAPFVVDARYGTRATTAIVIRDDGGGEILEWTHDAAGERVDERHHHFGDLPAAGESAGWI
jgi:uncharacterized protein with NRDE domain